MSRFLLALALVGSLAAAGSCRRSPEDAAPVGATPKIDAAEAIRTAQLAFRADGDRFSARSRHLDVQVSSAGRLEIAANGLQKRLTLETAAVCRGTCGTDAATARVTAHGTVEVARGEATELLQNVDEGVEQSWRFEKAPQGKGDLVVRVEASGLTFSGATRGGLHFSDATGVGLRYGVATFVDAAGVKTELAPSFEGGEIRIVVPASVIDGARFPAVLDPLISAELSMDAPITGPADGDQGGAVAAFDGTNYLVVFYDSRAGANRGGLYGVRVNTSGTLVDPTGFPITSGAGTSAGEIAFDGTNFFVTWSQTSTSGNSDIYAARVSPAGAVLDTTPIVVTSQSAYQYAADIACSPSNCLVVWQDYRSGASYDIVGARLDKQGKVLDPNGLAISVYSGEQSSPSVVWDGTDYVVAWSDARNNTSTSSYTHTIYAGRVTTAGAMLDGNGVSVGIGATPQKDPKLASDGTNIFCTWWWDVSTNPYSSQKPQVLGVRFTNALLPLQQYGTLISTYDGYYPRVAYDPTYVDPTSKTVHGLYYVVWRGSYSGLSTYSNHPHAARIDATTGGNLDSNTGYDAIRVNVDPGTSDDYPAIAFDGTRHLVVWGRYSGNGTGSNVVGARIGNDGKVVDAVPRLYSQGANAQHMPAAAWNGSEWLVVWQDQRNAALSDIDLYGVRLDASGAVLDPNGIAITTAAKRQTEVQVASNGTGFLVVWTDERDGNNSTHIYGTRVAADGTVQDPSGIALSQAGTALRSPAVASDGTGYFVVWEDNRSSTTVYGTRVDAQGAVTDPFGIKVGAHSGDGSPSVGFNGSTYVVAYGRGSGYYSIYATPVSTAGVVGTTFAVATGNPYPSYPQTGVYYEYPVIACAPSGTCLAAFMNVPNATGTLYARRISSTAALDTNLLTIGGNSPQQPPSVAFAGNGFLVSFETANGDVMASRVGLDGTGITPGGFGISNDQTLLEQHPAIAADGSRFLVAYDRFDPALQQGAFRVKARFVERAAQGSACTSASDCASGFCVDGVCCNSACGNGDPNDCQACSVAKGASADGTCTPAAQGTLCRKSTGQCDADEVCDGANGTCPADAPKADGTTCDDKNPCTQTDTCQAGACKGANPVVCTAQDACHTAGVCDTTTGKCSNPAKPDYSACDDGDLCTQSDFCRAGACIPSGAVYCPSPSQCQASNACDPKTGQCVATPKADGASCSDGNACTQSDTCQSGVCKAGAAVVCQPLDSCHTAGVCNTFSGVCSNPVKADGASCDDGNACTLSDTCKTGKCVGGPQITCSPNDTCHSQGTCDPKSGTCSFPQKPDGSACTDNDRCTQTDTCKAGACVGGNPVTCVAPDGCHTAGTCQPATGTCKRDLLPDGTACDDKDACTTKDVCKAGSCAGAAVTCAPTDECHRNDCDPTSGACAMDTKPDGTVCADGKGRCRTGTCVVPQDPSTVPPDAGTSTGPGAADGGETSLATSGCGCMAAEGGGGAGALSLSPLLFGLALRRRRR